MSRRNRRPNRTIAPAVEVFKSMAIAPDETAHPAPARFSTLSVGILLAALLFIAATMMVP